MDRFADALTTDLLTKKLEELYLGVCAADEIQLRGVDAVATRIAAFAVCARKTAQAGFPNCEIGRK